MPWIPFHYMMPHGCSSSRLLFHLLIWSPPLNVSIPRENLIPELSSAAQVNISYHSQSLNPFLPFPSAPSAVIYFSKGKLGINGLLPVQAAFLGSCLLPPEMCLSGEGRKQKAAENCLLALRNSSSHSSQGDSGSLLLPVGCPGWKSIAWVCPSLQSLSGE